MRFSPARAMPLKKAGLTDASPEWEQSVWLEGRMKVARGVS